ncbi:MAG: phospholipid carrier-dependent glycosyltransferase [Planctomycetes bacterium]|nr:phospholipid carrier-dependent glycosyltransferase [Planctomycetota bacterium]
MTEGATPTAVRPAALPVRRTLLVLAALYLAVYVAPLGLRPLFVPDESRYAEIPRAMLADGDWSRPRLAGFRYYEKPPLGYWLTALSLRALGETRFAARLPMALAAGLSALIVFLLVRRVRDTRRATAAAIVFLSCVQVYGVGTFLVLDSLFALFVAASMACLFLAERHGARHRLPWAVLAGTACAGAFLTKGLVALAVPALTLLVWFPWEKRGRELLRVWLAPVAAAGVCVLPLAFHLHAANPDFWEHFLWVEHVQRFVEPASGQHAEPVWFYIPVALIGGIPWTFLLPVVAVAAAARARRDELTRFCLSWVAGPFVFFSLCGGKLPTYLLPFFAPFAVLTADAVLDTARPALAGRCLRAGGGVLAAGAAVFLALAFTTDTLPIFLLIRNDPAAALPLTAAVLVAAGCLFRAGGACGSGRRFSAIAWTGLSVCGLAVASVLFLPGAAEDRKSPSRLLAEALPDTPADALIIADRAAITSVCWLLKRNDVVLYGSPGELAYGLRHGDGRERHIATAAEAADRIVRALATGRPVSLVVRDVNYAGIAAALPARVPDAMRERSIFVWAVYRSEARDPYQG